MILADKIITLRKRNGWSQEDLAEKLGVSRQSVSKWEGAASIPDLGKIIKMSELFSVSTDYLLKDDIESEAQVQGSDHYAQDDYEEERRSISIEEATSFIDATEHSSRLIAIATVLCILSPAVLLFLCGLCEMPGVSGTITENMAGAIGITALFIMVAIAVALFISNDLAMKKYEFFERESFELAYGVAGIVQEQADHFEGLYHNCTVIGVTLCIISAMPLVISSFIVPESYAAILVFMVVVLLIFVSVAVFLFIRTGMMHSCYAKLLQIEDFSISQKKNNAILDVIDSVFWSVAVAIYLFWSFITNNWGFTWIVWPIAGVIFGVYKAIAVAILNNIHKA